MKPNTLFVLSALVITLLAAGCNKTPSTSNTPAPSPTPSTAKSVSVPPANPDQTPNTIPTIRANPSPTTGTYDSYSTAHVEAAHTTGKRVVLFFHADWCPFCVEADKQFKARLSELPANTVVLKTNYDTETALKKKYAVTYQHTFVQVDANGNLVSKWNGGDVENLKKYLK